jgi:hypothetical protein
METKPDPVTYCKLHEAMLGVVLHLHKLLSVEETVPDLGQERVPVLELAIQGLNLSLHLAGMKPEQEDRGRRPL